MRNTLLTTLATLAKEWRVTLQFRPTEYITGSPHGHTTPGGAPVPTLAEEEEGRQDREGRQRQ